jgi:hypothetical protein
VATDQPSRNWFQKEAAAALRGITHNLLAYVVITLGGGILGLLALVEHAVTGLVHAQPWWVGLLSYVTPLLFAAGSIGVLVWWRIHAEPNGPKAFILRTLREGYFQYQPIKPAEFQGLVDLCDFYRRRPWETDPELAITPSQGSDGAEDWRMSLTPLSAYQVEADKRYETLTLIRRTLLEELIPRMKRWNAWRAEGG